MSLLLNCIDWDNKDIDNKYVINGYGINNDGNSVGLRIVDFKPEFYIRICNKDNNDEYMDLIEDRLNTVKKNLEVISKKSFYCNKKYESESESESDEEDEEKRKSCRCLNCTNIDLLKYNDSEYDNYIHSNYWKDKGYNINFDGTEIVYKKDLYDGFNFDDQNKTSSKYYPFLKISFNNIKSFNKIKSLLNYEVFNTKINNKKKVKNRYIKINNIPINNGNIQFSLNFYESNMQPLLRFFHKRGFKPVGWISIELDKLKNIDNERYFNCDQSYEVLFSNVNNSERIDFGNFKILSWDIEADSEYGDFPSAIKEYNKQGAEIADYYLEKINKKEIVDKNNIKNILKKMFNFEEDIEDKKNVQYINKIQFKKDICRITNKNKSELQKYISKLGSKIFEICEENKSNKTYNKDDNIFNKWLENKKNDKKEDESDSDSDFYSDYDDDQYKTSKEKEEEDNLKTNRDIIIYRINKLLLQKIGKFVRGDRITQIGAVFYKYGTQDEYDKFILTLGSCDSFNDDCVIIKTTNDDNTKLKSSKTIIKNALEMDENKLKVIPFYYNETYDNFNNKELDKLESKLILTFKELILQYNPDMILAFNNFGFDNPYLMNRCKELKLLDQKCCNRMCNGLAKYCYSKNTDKLYCQDCRKDNMEIAKLKESFNINRLNTEITNMETKTLSSAALGDNTLYLINSKGRVHIDLLKEVQRCHNLESYKLDFIAEKFLGDHKEDISPQQIFAYQKMDGYHRGMVASYCVQDCVLLLNLIKKLDSCASNMGMANVSLIPFSYIFLRGQGIKIQSLVGEFCMHEDTLLKTLNKNFSDDSYEGAVVLPPTVGMYLKDGGVGVLDYASLYPNSMIGSNISHDTIVESLMTDYKSLDEIENLKFDNMREGIKFENLYEVIKNKNPDFTEDDINNLIKDIESRYHIYPLYDSIYIPEIKKRYVRFINYYKLYNKKRDNPNNNRNLNIAGYNYVTVYFDTYKGKGDKKRKNGIKKLTFANPIDTEEKGIMCKILKKLLAQRKYVRKVLMPAEPDEFKKGVYEGLQLAYKQSANSLYGQTGSSVSCIAQVDLASSTTSTGRQMLSLCKSFAEEYFECDVVYGDTDSIFLRFHDKIFDAIEGKDLLTALNQNLTKKINYDDNTKISKTIKGLIEIMDKTEGKTGLKISILRCEVLSAEIAQLLRPPHDLEYEKNFCPFLLLSKKRYVGTLYEHDVSIGKLKYMGIVLKRRDNAQIVKTIYGGIIDKIMKEKNIESSIEFLHNKLDELIDGKIPIEDLTITKTLRGHYKNRTMIAHACLADRIEDRTGEKVPSNTRIPYAYVNIEEKKGVTYKQGDRIELPSYIKENNLKLDYKFYITNQLMKPILQIYDLEMKNPESVFADAIRKSSNIKTNTNEITKWFQPVGKKEIKTNIKLEKGCIYMIKKGITAKKKCNKDVVPGTNYCEKHCKKEKIENKNINTLNFEKLLKV